MMGKCSKCNMLVKLSSCELNNTATVMFRSVYGSQRQVKFFHKEIVGIVGCVSGLSLAQKLLQVPRLKLCVNRKDNVFSASIANSVELEIATLSLYS